MAEPFCLPQPRFKLAMTEKKNPWWNQNIIVNNAMLYITPSIEWYVCSAEAWEAWQNFGQSHVSAALDFCLYLVVIIRTTRTLAVARSFSRNWWWQKVLCVRFRGAFVRRRWCGCKGLSYGPHLDVSGACPSANHTRRTWLNLQHIRWIWALISYTRNSKTFQNFPSHQILRHIHEILNIYI